MQGEGFNPWSGNEDPASHEARQKKEKKGGREEGRNLEGRGLRKNQGNRSTAWAAEAGQRAGHVSAGFSAAFLCGHI